MVRSSSITWLLGWWIKIPINGYHWRTSILKLFKKLQPQTSWNTRRKGIFYYSWNQYQMISGQLWNVQSSTETKIINSRKQNLKMKTVKIPQKLWKIRDGNPSLWWAEDPRDFPPEVSELKHLAWLTSSPLLETSGRRQEQ